MKKKIIALALSGLLALQLFGCTKTTNMEDQSADEIHVAPSNSEVVAAEKTAEQTKIESICGIWEYCAPGFGARIDVQADNTFLIIYEYAEDEKTYIKSGTYEYSSEDETCLYFTATAEDDGTVDEMQYNKNEDTLVAGSFVMERSSLAPADFFTAPLLAEASAEVVDSVAYLHADGNFVLAYASAVIENTGKTSISITNISCDIEDETEAYLAHIDNYSFSDFCPEIIQPGERSYVATLTIADAITDAKISVVPKFHIEFEGTPGISAELDTENFEIIKYSGTYYGINGRVINPYEFAFKNSYAALALFDSNNNYLGLIVSDDLDMIEQYGKMGIPDTDVPIPQEFPLDDVATILPMAYAKQ